jgi:hypothetical protein
VPGDISPDHSCWTCGALPHAVSFACPECARRWEEMLSRELRRQLFGLHATQEHSTA